MAKYVDNFIKGDNLIDKDEIYGEYGMKEFVLLVLGGDLRIKLQKPSRSVN